MFKLIENFSLWIMNQWWVSLVPLFFIIIWILTADYSTGD